MKLKLKAKKLKKLKLKLEGMVDVITPNKRALIIGINYYGSNAELKGCINDAYNMKNYLLEKGFLEENILVMTDEDVNRNTGLWPNYDNILRQMRELSSGEAKELFFHYSGHGSYTFDWGFEERDLRDECIFPVDLRIIKDDAIRSNLIDTLPVDAKLRMVIDACNSGTGADLPFRYVPLKGIYKENHTPIERDVVCISGSRDDQLSYDAFLDGQYQGALTNNLLKLLRKPLPSSMGEWQFRDFIQVLQWEVYYDGFPQTPQLSMADYKAIYKAVDF